MPISNQPTYNSALQVAMQAGQRRDNLAGMQMQARQAGIQAEMGLLSMAIQQDQFDRSLGQADRHFSTRLATEQKQFDARMKQLNEHFDQQMNLATTQQEINRVQQLRSDQAQIELMRHNSRISGLQEGREQFSMVADFLQSDNFTKMWGQVQGTDRGNDLMRGVMGAFSEISAQTRNVFDEFSNIRINEQGLIDFSGAPTTQGDATVGGVNVGDGRLRGSAGQGGTDWIQAFGESLLQAAAGPAPGEPGTVEGNRLKVATDAMNHLNIDPDRLPPDVMVNFFNPDAPGFAGTMVDAREGHEGPRRFGGIIGKIQFLRDLEQVSEDHRFELVPTQKVKDALYQTDISGDPSHLLDVSQSDYNQWANRMANPSFIRRWLKGASLGTGANWDAKVRNLEQLETVSQSFFNATFDDVFDPEKGNYVEAYEAATSRAHLPQFQRYAVYRPALEVIYQHFQDGRGITGPDSAYLQETLDRLNYNVPYMEILGEMKKHHKKGRVTSYNPKDTNRFGQMLDIALKHVGMDK